MKGIPKNIKTLECFLSVLLYEDKRNITYTIDDKYASKCHYTVVVPRYWRPDRSDEIVEQNKDFSNGFKLVKTSNGEFGYVREFDGILMPYRYDIAFDFNEYGLAMVGKDGNVSWIDKDFNYINREGEKEKEEIYSKGFDSYGNNFKAWQRLEQFSKGEIPIAKLYDGRNTYATIRYIDTNGNIKKFYKFDGKIDKKDISSFFRSGTSFDKKGVAKADGSYLFARGYYIAYDDILEMAISRGFVNELSKEAEQALNNKKGKRLINVLQNPDM